MKEAYHVAHFSCQRCHHIPNEQHYMAHQAYFSMWSHLHAACLSKVQLNEKRNVNEGSDVENEKQTVVVENEAGRRTRVRVGEKEEAKATEMWHTDRLRSRRPEFVHKHYNTAS